MQDVSHEWYSDEISTFGDRVAGAREVMQMSQADLSERLGVKLKTICSWEDDLVEPRSNRLVQLSGVLNVSVMWLLNGQGDGIAPPDDSDPDRFAVKELLSDMRDLRNQMQQSTDHLVMLERRLRHILKSQSQHGND